MNKILTTLAGFLIILSLAVGYGNFKSAGVGGFAPPPGLSAPVSLTTQVSGTLPVANGGTGATTFTSGALLVGNGTGAVTATTTANLKTTLALNLVENTALSTWAGSTNLTTLGTISAGTWGGDTIAVNKGGTGLTSYTLGDVLYASGTGTLAGTSTPNLRATLQSQLWAFSNTASTTFVGAVGIATTSPTATLMVNGNIVSEPNRLTDGATITIDWSQGNVHYVTLGDNRALAFSNVQIGQSIRVYVTQDGAGSRTLTYPTVVWKDATAPTLTTTGGKTDILVFTTATSTGTIFGSYSTGY